MLAPATVEYGTDEALTLDGGKRLPGTAADVHAGPLERIAVVGCIGAGKSTAARRLGEALDIEVFHLDHHWWKPGRYRVTGPKTVAARTMDPTQFRRLEQEVVAGDRWIVDGGAANKDLRLSRADTVVFLDLPRWRCVWGVVRRQLTGSYQYPEGVRGSWRWAAHLIRWVWRTWPSKRRPALLHDIRVHAPAAILYQLRTRRQVDEFIRAVASS